MKIFLQMRMRLYPGVCNKRYFSDEETGSQMNALFRPVHVQVYSTVKAFVFLWHVDAQALMLAFWLINN